MPFPSFSFYVIFFYVVYCDVFFKRRHVISCDIFTEFLRRFLLMPKRRFFVCRRDACRLHFTSFLVTFYDIYATFSFNRRRDVSFYVDATASRSRPRAKTGRIWQCTLTLIFGSGKISPSQFQTLFLMTSLVSDLFSMTLRK